MLLSICISLVFFFRSLFKSKTLVVLQFTTKSIGHPEVYHKSNSKYFISSKKRIRSTLKKFQGLTKVSTEMAMIVIWWNVVLQKLHWADLENFDSKLGLILKTSTGIFSPQNHKFSTLKNRIKKTKSDTNYMQNCTERKSKQFIKKHFCNVFY